MVISSLFIKLDWNLKLYKDPYILSYFTLIIKLPVFFSCINITNYFMLNNPLPLCFIDL